MSAALMETKRTTTILLGPPTKTHQYVHHSATFLCFPIACTRQGIKAQACQGRSQNLLQRSGVQAFVTRRESTYLLARELLRLPIGSAFLQHPQHGFGFPFGFLLNPPNKGVPLKKTCRIGKCGHRCFLHRSQLIRSWSEAKAGVICCTTFGKTHKHTYANSNPGEINRICLSAAKRSLEAWCSEKLALWDQKAGSDSTT